MDDPLVVGVGEGVGHLEGDGTGLLRGKELFFEEKSFEILAGKELHDDVMGIFLFGNIIDPNNMGMIQAGEGAGFSLKPLQEGGITSILRMQDLDGDRPVEGRMDRLIDYPHAAAGDLPLNLIFCREEAILHR
jgi:hypothetical protein